MPLDPALEMIAAIIVEDIAIPIFPKIKEIKNKRALLITNDSNKTENKKVIAMFIKKTRITLKSNLPENMVAGDAISWRVKVVPRSSSETNARDNPDIAEKNITTHKSPPVKYSVIFSCPIENSITLIVTSINIARALIA